MNIENYYKIMPEVEYYGDKKPAWVGRYRTWIFYWSLQKNDYVAANIMTYWDGQVFRYTNLEDISNYECAIIWQWSFWPVVDVCKNEDTLRNCEKAGIASDKYYEPEFGPGKPFIHCSMLTIEEWKAGYVKSVSKKYSEQLRPLVERRKTNEN